MQNAVLSLGMGVESVAILLRWIYEPETRPCPLENLTVITSMTGDEFADTGRDMSEHVLPLMREYGIRFVQVARKGPKVADGISILSDSNQPEQLYLEGDYKLSDELAASGVVASYAGAHTCSMKSKAAVIEQWLDEHYEKASFGHAFGYSATEEKRVAKSNEAFRVRNVAFGFSIEEIGRAERAKVYDTPIRLGFYPLIEWGWDRETCLSYIRAKTGITWMKSACVYCPFAHNKSNLGTLEARQKAHPEQTAAALVLEHMSLALNPRGSLYRAETLATMAQRSGNTPALDLYRGTIAAGDWAIYRVRRLYGAKGEAPGEETANKGTVQRAVEKIAVFRTENDALSVLLKQARHGGLELEVEHGIHYAYAIRRGDGYPAREEYFVAAPALVEDKTRYGIDKFNAQWEPNQFAIEFTAA